MTFYTCECGCIRTKDELKRNSRLGVGGMLACIEHRTAIIVERHIYCAWEGCGIKRTYPPGKSKTSKYCAKHQHEQNKKRSRESTQNQRSAHLKGRYTVVDHIECKCPKCGCTHRKDLYYTGKFPARFFCHDCKGVNSKHSTEPMQFSKGGYTG